jgi:hypothetical protein
LGGALLHIGGLNWYGIGHGTLWLQLLLLDHAPWWRRVGICGHFDAQRDFQPAAAT